MMNTSLTAFVATLLLVFSLNLEFIFCQRIFGFGANTFGELAVGNQYAVYSPLQLDSSLRSASNSPSAAHSMFISDQSKALAAGNNEFAQFGNGLNFLLNSTELVPSEGTAQSTFRSRSIIETAGGRYFSLFLDSRRTVLSCGISSTFLGRITTALRPASEPFSISFSNTNITYLDNIQDTVLSIHAGSDFSILLTRRGKVISFGNNHYGQLGVGDLIPRQLPVEVPLLEPIIQVAVGSAHVLALAESGSLYVWGANNYEQLGRIGGEALLPERVNTSAWNLNTTQPILRVGVGAFHSFVLFKDSSIMVLFGSNEYGQIMGETSFSTFSVIDVKQLLMMEENEPLYIKQATGSHANTYFITSQGNVYSMGESLGSGEAYFPVITFENDTSTNSTDPPQQQKIHQILIPELDASAPKTLATTSFAAFIIEGTVCYSVYHNSSSVCSGHGKCVDYDICQCEGNYFGRECEMTFCKGLASNDSLVCEGKGACLQEDLCTCFNRTLWGGNNCETPLCHGILATFSSVCSGYGSCTAPNQCKCKENYFGDACQYTTCFGESSFNSSICGNGTCVAYNTCACKEDYSGDRCQYFKPTPKPTFPMPRFSSNSKYRPSEAGFVLPLPPTIAASVVMFFFLCFGFVAFLVILVLFALLMYRKYLTQRERRLGRLLEEAKKLHIDVEMPNVIKTVPTLGEEDLL